MILISIPPSTPKFTAISCFHESKVGYGGHGLRIIPARDRVIDLGKYRGKMLGSLPSSYLNWVSQNLRAGDTEEWAKLADDVLCDAVYKDRIEWEFAENVLNGNNVRASFMGNDTVSVLLEISKRFGWDNEDKAGWSKIDFGLLGTSNGGRIPRLATRCNVKPGHNLNKEEMKSEDDKGGRRRARRERTRQLRNGCGTNSMALEKEIDKFQNQREEEEHRREIASPFPGREALYKKAIINRKGFNDENFDLV